MQTRSEAADTNYSSGMFHSLRVLGHGQRPPFSTQLGALRELNIEDGQPLSAAIRG